MCSPLSKFLVPLVIPVLLTLDLRADNFPDTISPTVFKAEVRALSRHNNLPNFDAEDDFLGLRWSSSVIADQNQDRHLVQGIRAILYPNTGYNVWVQLSEWPGDTPHFAVSTGLQYEFPGKNPRFRRAIGLGWSEGYGSIHTQRDIQAYAFLGRSSKRFELGITGALTMQHVLVEDGNGIPDYDETFLRLMPYIGAMIFGNHFVQLVLPYDNKGAVLNLSYEIQLGARE
jgi:hypothetical protein